ncbi:MAG TPA: DUF2155 domain-containing protein [Xanthobacteraceae bacterium]|nr:DUF2155 domain-containing protein [Xanthobacteraceae bacterium]
MSRFSTKLLAAGALFLLASPASSQFGSIFDPPRPPGSIPNEPDLMPPQPLPPGPPPGAIRPPAEVEQRPLPPPPAAGQAPSGARQQPPWAAPPPADQQQQQQPNIALPAEEPVPEPPTPKIANPTAVFAGLDKITGRITKFDVAINETVRFGALEVTPRVCYTRPPTELPHTDGFVEVDELTLQGELRRIFTGWMFAASPGLNAVEHPIYDVWLTDCKGGTPPSVAVETPAEPVQRPARQPQRQPRPQPPR